MVEAVVGSRWVTLRVFDVSKNTLIFLTLERTGRDTAVRPPANTHESAYVAINAQRQRDDRTYAPITNRTHDRSRRAIALSRVAGI